MALLQAGSGGAYALSLALIVAAIYLAIVRFMDLNEKEPLWAVGMVFALGAAAAAVLPLLVGSTVLELSALGGPVAEESAKFVALALGVVALSAVARSRGWSEINGLMDGVVYGTAVGFGYATGEAFIRELSFGGALGGTLGGGSFAVLWTTALSGLSDGLFGAVIGAGFGAAVGARSATRQVGYPVAGLIGAVVVHALYTFLAQGNALGGSSARVWVSLAIPVVFVVAVVAVALVRERRAIHDELSSESETGAVTGEELSILRSFTARRARYARAFMKGDFDGWLAMRELHNRQVQLALAKDRAVGETDPESRAAVSAEVERLRAAVLTMKLGPEVVPNSADPGKAGA